MKNEKKKHRAASIAALAVIAFLIIMLIAGALMQHTGIIMTAHFALIVFPVLIYLFMMLTGRKRDNR